MGSFHAAPYEAMDKGAYEARLVKIEEQTGGPFGDALKWFFEILDEDYEGKEIMAFSSQAFNPASKAWEWTAAILGREIEMGEDIDFDDLTGKKVNVHIDHKVGERGTFEKVASLSAVRQKKKKKPAPAPEPEPEEVDEDDDNDEEEAPF